MNNQASGHNQTAKKNIAVVGAGVLGLLLSYRLLKDHYQVTLFDQSLHTETCSWAAGGMIAPYCELESGEELIFQLGLYSLSLWKEVLSEVKVPFYMQHAGSLIIGYQQDFNELKKLEDKLFFKQQKFFSHSYSGSDHPSPFLMEKVRSEKIFQLEPELDWKLRQTPYALFFPDEGQVDARSVLKSLTEEVINLGVKYFPQTKVKNIHPHHVITEINSSLNSSSNSSCFDLVIDCRGLGAYEDWKDLRAVRGEIIHLYAPDVHLHRPIRVMHPRYPLYVIPRPNHHYLIGATSLESQVNYPVTVRSTLELLSAAYSLHSGFAEAQVIELVTGLRPALPHHQPEIKFQPGLMRINGLYRHGFLLSPKLTDLAVKLISQHFGFNNHLPIKDKDQLLLKELIRST